MKKLLYYSLIIVVTIGTLNGCKKKAVKGCTDSKATNYNSKATEDDGTCTYPVTNPYPTNGYVIFTLNGPGFTNKEFVFRIDKDIVTRNEYNLLPNGDNSLNIDMDKGDTSIQVRFSDNTTGYKTFTPNSIYFIFTINNAINPITATSETGGYQVTAFTPTNLVLNTSSGAYKGKAVVEATFSGQLKEDFTSDTYTVSSGRLKFDGN